MRSAVRFAFLAGVVAEGLGEEEGKEAEEEDEEDEVMEEAGE